jgi:DNA replication protein DnaC
MSRDEIEDELFASAPRRIEPAKFQCPRHGDYAPSPRAEWPNLNACPACLEAAKAIEDGWKQAWATYDRWKRTLAPERFCNRRFTNYQATTAEQLRALAAAQAVASNDMQALALIGSVGTGKTHLSVAIVADAVRAGVECLWVTVPDLFRQWKQTFAKGAETTEQQILDRINRADLLVLDEIGIDNRSEWEVATLFDLVDTRYREGGGLVLTGNVTNLASAIGDRAADRIDEMGTIVTLTGASYRGKAADDPALKIADDFTRPPEKIERTVCHAGKDRRETRERTPPGPQWLGADDGWRRTAI